MSAYPDPYASSDPQSHVTPETEFDDERRERIKAQLEEVLDPCSCLRSNWTAATPKSRSS
jgi:hypothetical protein